MINGKVMCAAAAVTVMLGMSSDAMAKQTRAQLVSMANSACEAALLSGDLAALEKVRREYKSVVTACSARASTAAAPASGTQSSNGNSRSERSFVESLFGGFGRNNASATQTGGTTQVADNSSAGPISSGGNDTQPGGGLSDNSDDDTSGDTGSETGGSKGRSGQGNAGNGNGNGGGNGTGNEGKAARNEAGESRGNNGNGLGGGGGNGTSNEGKADNADKNDGDNGAGADAGGASNDDGADKGGKNEGKDNNGKSENAGGKGKN
ncbi:MAG: hypothetical protein ACK4ZJ_01975 [Allorhizobium sp.]